MNMQKVALRINEKEPNYSNEVTRELCKNFSKIIKESTNSINIAIKEKDFNKIIHLALNIKSASTCVYQDKLVDLATELRSAAKKRSINKVSNSFKILLSELKDLID